MIIKTKCIPIKDEIMGRSMVKEIRKIYGDATANKVKLVKKISFNVPVYDFGTDKIAYHIPETSDWYLEFPKEIDITI